MNSRKAPILLAAVGVVVAVGLFLLLKDDTADEDTIRPEAPASQSAGGDSTGGGDEEQAGEGKPKGNQEVTLIKIEDGQPVGGVKEIEVPRGGEIRAFIVSDADDELHLHGYDVTLDLKAGKTARLSVPATIEGLFELESHTTGQLVAEISVVPS